MLSLCVSVSSSRINIESMDFNVWIETVKVRDKDRAALIESLRDLFEDAWMKASESSAQELREELDRIHKALHYGAYDYID